MKPLAKLTAAAAIAAFSLGFAGPAMAGEYETDLTGYNGKKNSYVGGYVGAVTVSGMAGDFTVEYDTSGGDWLIVEIHTHAVNENDCSTVPQTGSGNPKIGKFDFQTSYSVEAADDMATHTITGLDGGGDNIVCIAAHAVVFEPSLLDPENEDLDTLQEVLDAFGQTAWGDGDFGTQFSSRNGWATYFTVDLSELPL